MIYIEGDVSSPSILTDEARELVIVIIITVPAPTCQPFPCGIQTNRPNNMFD